MQSSWLCSIIILLKTEFKFFYLYDFSLQITRIDKCTLLKRYINFNDIVETQTTPDTTQNNNAAGGC